MHSSVTITDESVIPSNKFKHEVVPKNFVIKQQVLKLKFQLK